MTSRSDGLKSQEGERKSDESKNGAAATQGQGTSTGTQTSETALHRIHRVSCISTV